MTKPHFYWYVGLNWRLRTECVGHYDAPTCAAVCPIDVVKPDPHNKESLDELAEKFVHLNS